MAGYTKDFLLAAYFSRYENALSKDTPEEAAKYRKMISDHYDKVGKDRFRVYASLDADALKKYRLDLKAKS